MRSGESAASPETATLGDAGGSLRYDYMFISMNNLNQAYKELYLIVYERLFYGYDVDPDCFITLNKFKGEVELDNSPFLIRKKLKCSICNKNIIRNKKFKRIVCFDCKHRK
jgi:hypothetical protein